MDVLLSLAHGSALGTMSFAELLGALSGLSCVFLLTREHIASWPIGIVNNVLFLLLFWHERLYADALLQVVFAWLGAYGWWRWRRAEQAEPLHVRHTSAREWVFLSAFVVVCTALATTLLHTRTDSPAPLWDASVLALSLAATYGQAQKQLESWYLWIAVDLCSIPLYTWRALYPTAVVYAVYMVFCVMGLRAWSRSLREQTVRSRALQTPLRGSPQ